MLKHHHAQPRQLVIANWLESLVLLTLAFVIHRLVIHSLLLGAHRPDGLHLVKWLAVGIASDVWIAGILSIVILGAGRGLRKIFPGATTAIAGLGYLMLVVLIVLLAGHGAYVQFYRHPIVAAHLAYLGDSQFLSSNYGSIFDPWWWLPAAAMVIVKPFLSRLHARFAERVSVKHQLISGGVALVLVLGFHVWQIKYRVQFFVPENLQANLLEGLALEVWRTDNMAPIGADEFATIGIPPSDTPSQALNHFFALPRQISPELQQIRSSFRNAAAAGRRPVVIVVLMESLRGIDVEVKDTASGKYAFAELHKVMEGGISFDRAYATGNVTRGAQEAIFCGSLGNSFDASMRGHPDVHWPCLPEFKSSAEVKSSFAWLHGGEGLFDGQREFWQKHGFNHFLEKRDFPAGPASPWGVSDRRLFSRSMAEIHKIQKGMSSDQNALVVQILTVTNHIPWQLPDDATQDEVASMAGMHESIRSAAYAVNALAEFVETIQSSYLWNDTIVLISGDHGHLAAPPLNASVNLGKYPDAETLSRVPIIMTGGLIPSDLAGKKFSHPISQVDLAFVLDYLLGASSQFLLGQDPFWQDRQLPVVSVVGQDVYLPAEQVLGRRQDVLGRRIPGYLDFHHGAQVGMVFYRAFVAGLSAGSFLKTSQSDSRASGTRDQ